MKEESINPLPREYSALNENVRVVREYAGTKQSEATVALLEEIERQYLNELRTVPKDGLQYTQGKLEQVSTLIRTFRGDVHSNGVV